MQALEQRIQQATQSSSTSVSQQATDASRQYTEKEMLDVLRLLAHREAQAKMEDLEGRYAVSQGEDAQLQPHTFTTEQLRATALETSFSPELIEQALKDYTSGALSADEYRIIKMDDPKYKPRFDASLSKAGVLEERCLNDNITFIGKRFSTVPFEIAKFLKSKGYMSGYYDIVLAQPYNGQKAVSIFRQREKIFGCIARSPLRIADITLEGSFMHVTEQGHITFYPTAKKWIIGVRDEQHIPEVAALMKEYAKEHSDVTMTIYTAK